MKYFNLFIVLLALTACTRQPTIKKSYLTSDTIFYADSSYEPVTMYGRLKNGVSITHKNGYTYRENLYINNRMVVETRFYSEERGYADKILYNINDTLWPIGVMWYDKNTLKKKQVNAIYFQVKAKDTVDYGDSIDIQIIGNLGTSKRFNMELNIGPIDPYGNLIYLEATYKTNNTELNFKVGDLKEGINLITGHLHYYLDGEDITNKYMDYNMMKIKPKYELPYIFYHQVYVRPVATKRRKLKK